jgi:hypothetical protein
MKKKIVFSTLIFIGAALCGNELFNFKTAPTLAAGAKRGQILTFVPDAPGSDRGIWRLTYTRKENKVNLAEMILKKEMPLPAFQKNLRIEMDLETGPLTRMVGIDMRLRDAKGEVCVVNGLKKWQSGKFTAVWTITPGQKIRYSWGRNVDKVLDMPAKITNISFAMHKDNTGNLLIKNIRFIADAE